MTEPDASPLSEHEEDALARTVYLSLLALTAATVGAASLGTTWGRVMAVSVALAIAAAKGSLVAMYFMHLKDEHPVIIGMVVAGLAGVLILGLGILPDIGLRPAG